MSKGGSTSSSVEIPAWLENAAIENINRARDVQRIGYTPYYGPDVAAFSPMQTQAMQATGMGAEAFGLAPSGFDPMAGMPQPQQFAGGLMGYSSAPLYEQSVDMLRQQRPAQASALEGLFIDPITGQYSAPSYAPTQEQIAQTAYTERSRNAALDAALRNAEINANAAASQPTSSPSQYIDPVSGKMSDVRMMSPSTPYLDPLSPMYDEFDNDAFPFYDFDADLPNVVIGDTRYVLDPDMTPTMPTLGDTGSQVFTLDGELVEDTLTRPSSAPDLRFASPSTPYTEPSILDSNDVYDRFNDSIFPIEQFAPEQVMIDGSPVIDSGLSDVVESGAGLALNTGLLGAAVKGLTGSYPVQNTPEEAAAIPVMDFGTVTSALPPVNTVASKPSKKKSSTSSLASQGPTGTYNQKYFADKLKSGATQAELKAEQDKIRAAGGKVYKGSPTTNRKSGSSTSSK